ncbi:uncharacterized protein LY79DRAFT_229508 [Colletotrichum navitas]|uniref:Uncharacterized protein n=1 Tax=Colletotrichum navitas TaxID=681940 RepID=A0AAD8V4A5_9PEZI|nr:uncharacterized protein LY79DRAFT_229508 [Colletotrichum navitas]KAK1590101.1 hypothetical protein LY79DRAFT_229508 [Colletotrichum navitas]
MDVQSARLRPQPTRFPRRYPRPGRWAVRRGRYRTWPSHSIQYGGRRLLPPFPLLSELGLENAVAAASTNALFLQETAIKGWKQHMQRLQGVPRWLAPLTCCLSSPHRTPQKQPTHVRLETPSDWRGSPSAAPEHPTSPEPLPKAVPNSMPTYFGANTSQC